MKIAHRKGMLKKKARVRAATKEKMIKLGLVKPRTKTPAK